MDREEEFRSEDTPLIEVEKGGRGSKLIRMNPLLCGSVVSLEKAKDVGDEENTRKGGCRMKRVSKL